MNEKFSFDVMARNRARPDAGPLQTACRHCTFQECSSVGQDRVSCCAFYEPNKWEGPDT